MYEYNDYIGTTKRWLRNYNQFVRCLENMREDIQLLEVRLKEDPALAAATAKYSDMPGGGMAELTSVEKAVSDRMRIEVRINQIKLNMGEIERIVNKLDEAMGSLDNESRELLEAHYIDGYTWDYISADRPMSKGWTRKKGNKALQDITFQLFGVRAKPPQVSFVFSE